MKQTAVTFDANGNVVSTTTVETRSGCSQSCGWFFFVIFGLFVVLAPAQYFPLWGAILAYIFEALLVIGGVVLGLSRRGVTS